MNTFAYARAGDLAAATEAAVANTAAVFAGGTDILPLMKLGLARPESLVDIKGIEALDYIRRQGDELELGALVTLKTLESDETVGTLFPLLQRAASLAASPQIRARATIGGNVLQRPRCWYFRHPDIKCWLKGGEDCPAKEGRNELHAIFRHGECSAVQPSDIATALVALNAGITLRSNRGERRLPATEFFVQPTEEHRRETAIADDELVTGVSLLIPPSSTRTVYDKIMERAVWTFAMSSCAIVLRVEANRVEQARIVLGGVANVPWRATASEEYLAGRELTPETIAEVARLAVDGAEPLGENEYKLQLVQGLVQSLLERIAGQG